MQPTDGLSLVLLAAGAFFFLTGTVGLLRFPDIYTRLHALTKADNLGLGLIVLSLALEAWSVAVTLQLVLIWLLVMGSSTTACHLVARSAFHMDIRPWKRS